MQKSLKDVIQEFNDEMFTDEELSKMIVEYQITEGLCGVKDELILGRIFEYLDNKLQTEIRSKLDRESNKNQTESILPRSISR